METETTTLRDQGMQTLFSPISIAGMELANRIVMAPMTRSMAPGGVHGPDAAPYYRRRADNGVGLIISEGSWIPHPAAANEDNVPRFYGEEALASWKHVLAEVHAAGGKMIPQLWHVGLMLTPEIEGIYSSATQLSATQCGPSGMVGGVGMMPKKLGDPMTVPEIEEVVDAFAQSAVHAADLGFDGIELHGAHGYLIDQFLWEETNLRDDQYGGSIDKRARFAADIVREIRRRTGPDFAISFRFSQWKGHDYNAKLVRSPQELELMLKPIVDAGVDMFDCSQRRFWEPEFAESDLNLAGWTQKVSGVSTMTVGSVSLNNELMATLMGESAGSTRIDNLLEMLARGDFDLVGVGRSLLANPDWPRLVEGESWDQLQPYTPSLLQKLY
jgi:2,4-dienoyl-CoA reductase-like NADH-dependent reductase (Old Yellow Enzyme family)